MNAATGHAVRQIGQVLRAGSKGKILSRSGRLYDYDGNSHSTIDQGDWVSFSLFANGKAEPTAEDLCFMPTPSAEEGQSHRIIAGKLGEDASIWFERILDQLDGE